MRPADTRLWGALALTTLLLASPLIGRGWADRLLMMAYLPAATLLGLLLACWPRRRVARAIGGMASVACLACVVAVGSHASQPSIPVDSIDELKGLARHIDDAPRTLVVTRHGLEWWAAWFLRTHVAQYKAIEASDWRRYDRVLFLRLLRQPGLPGPGLSDVDRILGSGPPPRQRSTTMQRPLHRPATPFPEVPIPANATVVHEGTHFMMARVDEPPARLGARGR
jgi:hypothetical protein